MEAVVFDWDGTLVDSLAAVYRANEAVFAAIGVPFDRALYRLYHAPDWRLMYRRLGVPDERLDEANEHWLRSMGAEPVAEAFPGAVEAVRRLARARVPMALVTAGHRSVVERQLEETGLATFLPVRVYGDDLPVQKPDPRPLRIALAELGVAARPSAAAYVGDTLDDMRMARAVGVHGVGIESSLATPDELRAAGATDVAVSVAAWVETLPGLPAAAPGSGRGVATPSL